MRTRGPAGRRRPIKSVRGWCDDRARYTYRHIYINMSIIYYSLYVFAYTHTHIYKYTYEYIHTYTYIHVYLYLSIYLSICLSIYLYPSIHIHIIYAYPSARGEAPPYQICARTMRTLRSLYTQTHIYINICL